MTITGTTDNILLGRTAKTNISIRCDYCNHIIPRGTIATKVYGQGIKAQGTYHGRRCYEAAKQNYEALEKKHGIK